MPKPAEHWEKEKVDSFISKMEEYGFRCRIVEGSNDYTWAIHFEKQKSDGSLVVGFVLGVYAEPAYLAWIQNERFERMNAATLPKSVPLMDAVR